MFENLMQIREIGNDVKECQPRCKNSWSGKKKTRIWIILFMYLTDLLLPASVVSLTCTFGNSDHQFRRAN